MADLLDCPEITVAGDPPAVLPSGLPSPFRGYADPTIRRDPANRLWMAYSWPSIQGADDGSSTTRVEIHLAHSDDDGATWIGTGALWAATPTTNVGGGAGFTDHEVPNLLPIETEGGVVWYGVRLDLFVPEGQSLGQRPISSFRIVLTTAASMKGSERHSRSPWGAPRPLLHGDRHRPHRPRPLPRSVHLVERTRPPSRR